MLEIKNLTVAVEGKEILHDVSLTVKDGERVALMGPNGSGKSTLAYALMGHPKYEVLSGSVLLDGTDVLALPADERARLGLFLSFQYPASIAGVTLASFLRQALLSRGQRISVPAFRKLLLAEMRELGMPESFADRALNQGFSGGEKKRAEILQLRVLKPRIAVLDETDSGLDIDAVRTVAEGVSALHREQPQMSSLTITHYQRILQYLQPDTVYVLHAGRIVRSGGKELALELERKGYGWITGEL